jgi:hypothetical protein
MVFLCVDAEVCRAHSTTDSVHTDARRAVVARLSPYTLSQDPTLVPPSAWNASAWSPPLPVMCVRHRFRMAG